METIVEQTEHCITISGISVQEFLYKYYKPDRIRGRMKVLVESSVDDMAKLGYAAISKFDNVLGIHLRLV